MSTIGLEVLEKPINFENILNVRNQLIFKNCNKFIDLFSDYCSNDELSLGYNQIQTKLNFRTNLILKYVEQNYLIIIRI